MSRIAIGVIALTVLAGTLAAQTLDWDVELPAAPCALKGPAAPLSHEGAIWVLYTCADDRVVLRQATGQAELPAATIRCPGTHAACALLPAGTYERAWADTVIGR